MPSKVPMAILERIKHDLYPFIDATKNLKGSANDKTVLVTGGSKGIGKAIAQHFALAGASKVIISGRTHSALEETKSTIEAASPHCEVVSVVTDMTQSTSVQKLYDDLPCVPDIVVNNVGGAACQRNVGDGDIDMWWSDLELNVKACYLSCRTYLRALKGKPGVILNLSSSVSNTTNPGLSSYGTSKTAVNRLTDFIDLEYSKQGVSCLAFHPGGILETGMGEQAPEYFKPFLFDTLDLAGGTAVYLATPRASFLDGRFVYANYDMEELEKHRDAIVEKDLLKTKIDLGPFLRSVVVPPTEDGS